MAAALDEPCSFGLEPMHVLYEETGSFKVGAVLAEGDASLQVEAPHGKRNKIKAANVLLRFQAPPLAELMGKAEALAAEMDRFPVAMLAAKRVRFAAWRAILAMRPCAGPRRS